MGYAVFAQRKLVLTSQLNSVQTQLNQRDNELYILATDKGGLKTQLTKLMERESLEKAPLYEQLVATSGTAQADTVKAQIEKIENDFEAENAAFQAQIDQIAIKENFIDMEKKNIETRISVIQTQLEKVEEAEGKGIDRATPKFSGLG